MFSEPVLHGRVKPSWRSQAESPHPVMEPSRSTEVSGMLRSKVITNRPGHRDAVPFMAVACAVQYVMFVLARQSSGGRRSLQVRPRRARRHGRAQATRLSEG